MKVTVDTQIVQFEIIEGIVIGHFAPMELVNVEIMKASVDSRLKFQAGVSYPCLFDVTNVKNFDRDARIFAADQGNHLVTANAILVSSKVQKMIVNMYMALQKPKSPTRLFTDKQKALEWLGQFKTK